MVSFALVCRQVDTVKRLLIKELPPVLAIQLKRFDYDWERECAIKFQRLLLRVPSRAGHGALHGGRRGQAGGMTRAPPESQVIAENSDPKHSSRYRLVGVSGATRGQAKRRTLLLLHRPAAWERPDRRTAGTSLMNGDVTECKMDDDEEMKNQCFGGE